MRTKIIPRGIRNNNPLNIRIGNTWLGEVASPNDPAFEQFISMAYGVRAACVILRRYIRHYHRTTIREIITSWAPSSENRTEAYIDTVAHRMGINPDDTIRYEDEPTIIALLEAMIFVETGTTIKESDLHLGYKMA